MNRVSLRKNYCNGLYTCEYEKPSLLGNKFEKHQPTEISKMLYGSEFVKEKNLFPTTSLISRNLTTPVDELQFILDTSNFIIETS